MRGANSFARNTTGPIKEIDGSQVVRFRHLALSPLLLLEEF